MEHLVLGNLDTIAKSIAPEPSGLFPYCQLLFQVPKYRKRPLLPRCPVCQNADTLQVEKTCQVSVFEFT